MEKLKGAEETHKLTRTIEKLKTSNGLQVIYLLKSLHKLRKDSSCRFDLCGVHLSVLDRKVGETAT